jgi:hypothetical protein
MLLAVALAAMGACGAALRDTAPARADAGGASVGAADLVVVATPHEIHPTESEIRGVHLDAAGARARVWAKISHAPDAVVRGDVLSGGRAAVVVADAAGERGDFGAELLRVADDGAVRRLARGVLHASRPLASADGRVYVERGVAGRWPTPEEASRGRLRVDELTIDAIDPDTGAARVLYGWSGYALHLSGELGGELVVYRVGPEGADLVAIDRASGASRLVTTLLPFARDFTIDAARGAIVMSNRDEHDSRTWVVDRVDLATGARTRLERAREELAPFVTPAGGLVGRLERAVVLAGTRDAAWLTSSRVVAGFDVATATHPTTGLTVRIGRDDERVEPIGFAGGGGVAR